MSIPFDCPFCSYKKNVPDNFYGKKIKCPRCLATLTLGVPQPTKLTALPLPETDPSLGAIELEKQEVREKECPICLQLVYEGKECSVYKRYTELLKESQDKQVKDEDLLKDYESIKSVAEKNYKLGFASLIYGLSFVISPMILYQNYKILPQVCENLERSTRRKLNASNLMAVVGLVSSLFVAIGLTYYIR
ncbi:hypothetical protein [Candidatus Uabimicrobium amorphum]|uniref:Uncharacterized protein n=1 Tax=Uabimicrobium amorphum TaxID=2596890 RepID=A0A5S9F2L7_UABAM|nr:hypothetical protein [Candidatus Uabimicrobium amorphum]BBM83736.1 hypothetical protein UABAM_02089 [Candidatus Uabimicrobium amorphum]